jgi:hypothetical protein
MKKKLIILLLVITMLLLLLPVSHGEEGPKVEATPSVDITLDKDTVAVGETITASWVCHNLPEGWRTNADWLIWYPDFGSGGEAPVFDVTTASFTPVDGLSGTINVYFYDANSVYQGVAGEKSFTITGWDPGPTQPPIPKNMQFTINLSADTVEVGTPITGTWTLSNVPEDWKLGVAVIWDVSESNGNNYSIIEHPDAATGTTTFIPPFGSSGSLYFQAYDHNWGVVNSVEDYKRFTITGSIEAPKLTITGGLNPTTITLGSPITASWTAQGGIAPYTYTYRWSTDSDIEEDRTSSGDIITTNTSVMFTPIKGKQGFFSIEVTDKDGRSVSDGYSFTLKPAPIKGDATGDGKVDILDQVAIIDYLVLKSPALSMQNADANGDGKVDILDLVWIIDRIIAN